MKPVYKASRRQRLLISLQIGTVIAGIILLLWALGIFKQTRLRLSNILYSPRQTSGNVVIVAIDDNSLQAYGRTPTEWSREVHAELVKIVSAGGARVLAFDILFAESTPEDELLAAAIREARSSRTATRVILPMVGLEYEPTSQGLLYYREIRSPVEILQNAAENLGSVNNIPDVDGTTRWMPLRITDSQDTYYAFALATYITYLRIPTAAIPQVLQFENGALHLPSHEPIPLDSRDRMMMNFFSVPDKATFPVYSYRDVLEGSVDPAVFNDKIVLVGLMNSAGQTDIRVVPIGLNAAQLAGVEVHANAIETILQKVPLHPQSARSQFLMILGLALVSSIIYGQLPRRYLGLWLLAASLAGMLIWVVVGALIFTFRFEVINLLDSLLAILLTAPSTLTQYAIQENRQRQRAELLLQSMIQASSQNMSLERVLPGIAADVCTILKTEYSEIWLWHEKKDELSCAYNSNANMESSPHEMLVREVLKTAVLDYQDKRIAMPLIWQGKKLGAFVAYPVRSLHRDTREMLHLFAWQTASVIININLLEETQKLSELKTFIIRMATHDLKNPLVGIINFSQYILKENDKNRFLNEQHEEFIEDIVQAAFQMRRIIEDILNMERVRGGERKLEPFDIVDLARGLIGYFDANTKLRGQKLTGNLPDEAIMLTGDSSQIHLALSNLINNAIKYTPEGGSISLTCYKNEEHVCIEVSDNGYGIPEEAQKNLFKEFYRVGTAETRDIEGTGLGLSLVKVVIEAHNGRIWVKSKKGEGSTFYVELPL